MNSAMNKIESQATSLGTKLNSISFDHIDDTKINRIKDELKDIQDVAKQDIELDFNVGDILSDLNRLSNEIKNLEKVENLASSFDKISDSIKDAGGDVEKFASSIKELEDSADKRDGSFEKSFKNVNDELKDMQSTVKKMSSDTKGKGLLGSILGSKDDFLGNFSSFTLAEIAGDFISDGIRQMASAWKDTIVETDAAMTDLRKVYDKNLTGDALKGYLNDVTEVAKGTGKSSVDVIQGTAKAVQSGISDINDALTYAKQASIFSNVGDVTQEQADTMLASIMSVYGGVDNALKPVREQIVGAGKDYNTLTKFMDLANYAGNNFAISTTDVGEALQLSAAALKTNGVSMEESVGMITAMNEITQDSRRTGTALKTISANMAGVTTSAKDGTIQTNKAAKALKEIAGIDVWNKQTGEIKDMYSVMDELNGKWGDLSEAQRNALAATIAGKTQLNTFNALMSNWDTARQYVKEYKEGLMVGSAERENEQYLDSIAGKWNVIKENMKAAGNTLVTSDMAKGFLDIGIVLSEGFNKGIEGLTKGVSSVLKGSIFTDISTSISDNLYRAFEKINLGKGLQGAIEFIFGDFDFFDGIGEKLATSLSSAIGKAFEISFSQTSMGKALKPIMDMLNIDGLFEGKKLDNQIDSRNENINAIQSEVQSLKNQKQAIEDILPTYDELSKKTNRSVEENQQLTDMRNQLADSNPDLVLGYDKNGTPILKNLQAQNKQYESQIKLKQQSQRLEENSLANDVLQRRVNDQKEFNKAYKEYNDMQLASNTKKKEGLFGFGSESTQDYAKRIIEDNKKITEANQKAYDQRLKDHQQYMQDEQAIQQKYINDMTQKSSFNRMSEEMKSGMLTLMDALDWTNFSPTEGNQFAGMLANLGDKLVPTTEAMGKQSKAIAQLSQDYANGKINLMDYTKGLTERYEAEKKFDAESFSTWRQDAQSYVDLTGDMIGASKAADVMAKSLSKITGIKASTWKTGLMFDPAPIDASNKALQKFLNSYGTGIQNMGKAKTDGLISQFETLQNSYTQMLDDISTQGTQAIDVEYLVNAKVNQPEPISELIDKIVSDNKVTESEIELLLNAQAEILNTGEISDETIKQIADEFNMTEAEVKAMLKIDAEVTGMEDLASQIEGWDELTNEEKELILTMTSEGEGEFKMSVEEWNQLTPEEKEEKLKLMAEGKEEIAEAKNTLEELPDEKNTNVNINAGDTSGIDKSKEVEELPDNKRILVDASAGDTSGIEKGKEVEELPSDKNVIVNTPTGDVTGLEKAKETETLPDNKNIMVNTPMGDVTGLTKGKEVETLPDNKNVIVNTPMGDTSGIEKGKEVETLPDNKQITVNASTGDTSGIEKAKEVEKLPKEKEIKVSIVQKAGNVLDSITNYFKAKAEQKVSLSVQVTGKDQVESLKNSISSLKGAGGNVTITATVNGKDQVESLKTSLSSMKNTNVSVTITGNALSQANQIKSSLMGIQNKNISINASGNALSQISSIKSAISGLQSKSISINASVNGIAQVNALKSSIAGLQGRTVSVSCSTSGTAQVNALTSAIARVNGKTVSVKASVSGTAQVNALTSAINRVKSKSVKVSASVSGTGAVQGLASAIASVHSKSVSVSVTKTVTTVQQSVGSVSATPISATPMLMNTSLADIPVSASDSTVDVPVSVSASATSGFNIGNILPSLNFNINMFKNLEDALENLSTQLGIINKKAENAFGEKKVKLLQQQIPILRQQQAIQEKIAQGQREQNSELTKWLKGKGFTFDSLGNIVNYNDKLLAMEQNVESLKKKYDSLNDAEKKNESAVKSAQKAYDTANEELTKTKGYLEDYFDTNNTEVLKATEKWYEYENAIIEAQNAIIEFQKELKKLNEDSGYKNVERDINEIKNKLDMNEVLLDRATGEESVKLLEERIELTKQLQKETQDLIDYENQLRNGLMKELNQYGFKFRDNGSIEGYSQQIEKLKKTLSEDEFDEVFDKVEEYLEKTYETIPDLKVEWEKFNNEILDSKDSIQEVKDEATNLLKELKELNEDSAYKDHERDLKEIEGLIKINEAKLNVANGEERAELLEKQIGLTKQLQKETKDMLDFENSRRNNLMNELSQYGFSFRDDGSIPGYGRIINELKQTLSEDEFEEVFKKIEDYLETTYDTIPDLEAEWIELNDEIVKNIDDLEKLNREMRLFRSEATLTSLTNQFDTLSNKLDIINSKLKYAYGVDQINLMKDSIGILNQQLDLQSKKINELTSQIKVYQKDLKDYGFEFDDLGNITNYEEMMDWFNDTDGLEKINDLTEEYFDKMKDLQDITADYHDLKNEIKDVYSEMLDATKEIEDKITDIIEKEYEKRKNEIEKYTDERIKLLEKEKKAYQDMRDEQDYEKSINEQTKEIADLQKKLETARKDNSIAGLKRQSEILKEIEEAQKKLEETTQDRIDDTYESNIDDEISRLEEEQEKLLASLDEKFSETNIAQMVAQAMASGVININGELKTLQDALIQSVNDSAEGYSVMADIIKNELVSNLNVALDTMQQIADINEKLGLQSFNVISATQAGITNVPTYDSGNSQTVTIGDTIINVSGSVDDITLGKIEDMIKEENERMLKEITSGI